ncbi:MAG: spore cortex biosynthesis protein YabQ [Oscillospiraceae bacterium]|nr:spore cortex biosynthesis protein YabQ [Oscillospiraceae bacterium]MBR4102059.1 spore cortex biosynthesis protein YabQ [Oscillospiraceae bacterium]
MTAALVIPGTYTSPEEQLLLFAGACLLGIPCGILFDSMRLLRRIVPHPAPLVALEDVLFPVLCGILLLGYTTAFAQSVFRFYYLWGCVLGFGLYECTLGSFILAAAARLCRILSLPFKKLRQAFALICKKVGQIFVKNNKKTEEVQQNTQNPLQDAPEMVYNKKRNIKKVKQNGKNNSQK